MWEVELRETLSRNWCLKYISGRQANIIKIERYEIADHILWIQRDFDKLQTLDRWKTDK